VSQTDADSACGGLLNKCKRVRKLRGEGDKTDVAPGGLLEAVEEFDAGLEDATRRMDAALRMGHEWALKVDTYRASGISGSIEFLAGVDGFGHVLEGAECRVEGAGDGGRKVVGGARAARLRT